MLLVWCAGKAGSSTQFNGVTITHKQHTYGRVSGIHLLGLSTIFRQYFEPTVGLPLSNMISSGEQVDKAYPLFLLEYSMMIAMNGLLFSNSIRKECDTSTVQHRTVRRVWSR